MKTAAPSLLLAAMLLSGCAQELGTRPSGLIEHPTGEAELVVRVDVAGGLLSAEVRLQAMPSLSIFGDGRIFVGGPQIEIYPPPAMVNPLFGKLSEDDLQEILSRAEEAQMLQGDRRIENNRVADAPTHVFLISARGRTFRTEAYALFETEAREAKEVRDFYEFISKFSDKADAQWEPDRIQVVVFQPQAETGPSDVEPSRLDWPLGNSPEEFGVPYEAAGLQSSRCGAVEGDELPKLRDALQEATTITLWLSGGKEYRLAAAPLLPDQSGCAAQPS